MVFHAEHPEGMAPGDEAIMHRSLLKGKACCQGISLMT
ncbi:hypothetical protein BN1221_01304c [Brenneria goodwinii]|uniref:Uncharacterized protein n=1 Tax=Brenneria goodwinii TaxID=1109412 RepID=A0A0G4JT25_9GAMM|nr:hypothetical protein BN1221_01304c [Brenneria goodwinii]